MFQAEFWENLPNMLDAEIRKMKESFPEFILRELPDGGKTWEGTVRLGAEYDLQIVYDEYYPNWWLEQDIIRVYCDSIRWEDEISALGAIPRALQDGEGRYYISTYLELFRGRQYAFSARDHLAHAVSWLKAFEVWKRAVQGCGRENPYERYFFHGKRLAARKVKRRVRASESS